MSDFDLVIAKLFFGKHLLLCLFKSDFLDFLIYCFVNDLDVFVLTCFDIIFLNLDVFGETLLQSKLLILLHKLNYADL